MKYALIGCGRISSNHISAAIANNLEIVGLSDLLDERATEKINKFNLKHTPYYSDYKIMLEKEKPQLVAIATESGEHARIALDCINAGCHVIIEKPIALSINDAKNVINTAEKKKIRVCACHQNRFNKSIQKMREAVDHKRLGKLFYGTAHIRWNRGASYYEQAKWRGTWEQDGGALMNQCIHNIDLLRWMLGDEISEVFAYTDNLDHGYINAEDIGIAIIKFKNGAYGIIEGTTNVFPSNLEETLYLFGEKGTVKAGGQSVNKIEEWKFNDGFDNALEIIEKTEEVPPNVYGFGHARLYMDMIDSIKTGRKPYVDGEAGLRALELVLAIYKSSKEKRPISFPINNFSTIDMKGFFNGK